MKILNLLKEKYGVREHFVGKPIYVLVGAILSAQCTDEVVAEVMGKLVKKYKNVEDFVGLKLDDIRKTGFYKNKGKNIKEACKIIIRDFNGRVPSEMDELVKLPGVGRKTANVILQSGFGIVSGVTVDTHVIRLSYRLGWTKSKNPEIIERDLMKLFSKKYWRELPGLLKSLGRDVCKSKPRCSECVLENVCVKNF